MTKKFTIKDAITKKVVINLAVLFFQNILVNVNAQN